MRALVIRTGFGLLYGIIYKLREAKNLGNLGLLYYAFGFRV